MFFFKHTLSHYTLFPPLLMLMFSLNPCQARTSLSDIATSVTQLQTEASTQQTDIDTQYDSICLLFNTMGGLNAPDFCPPFNKIVFITKEEFGGWELNGAQGADYICQNEADHFNLKGKYKAWISQDNRSFGTSISGHVPADGGFMANITTDSSLRFVNPIGEIIAEDWEDLTDGHLNRPINIGPDGVRESTTRRVWTALEATGKKPEGFSSIFCADWSSNSRNAPSYLYIGMFGISSVVSQQWSRAGTMLCNERAHLYCFQQ